MARDTARQVRAKVENLTRELLDTNARLGSHRLETARVQRALVEADTKVGILSENLARAERDARAGVAEAGEWKDRFERLFRLMEKWECTSTQD